MRQQRSLIITQSCENIRVSLVDGDPTIRRARQIMLRSEQYDVRSYSTCAALLADPVSRDYPCIVLDVGMHGISGLDVLRQMRATGWWGTGILLDQDFPNEALSQEAHRHGDRVFDHGIGDRALIAAIAASVECAGNSHDHDHALARCVKSEAGT
jgi:FixJ family two-component response regulator